MSSSLHKVYRGAFGQYFSRLSVLRLEGLIKESGDKVCYRLQEARRLERPFH